MPLWISHYVTTVGKGHCVEGILSLSPSVNSAECRNQTLMGPGLVLSNKWLLNGSTGCSVFVVVETSSKKS